MEHFVLLSSETAELERQNLEMLKEASDSLKKWRQVLSEAKATFRSGFEGGLDSLAPGALAGLELIQVKLDNLKKQHDKRYSQFHFILRSYADVVDELEAFKQREVAALQTREKNAQHMIASLAARLREHDSRDATLATVFNRALSVKFEDDVDRQQSQGEAERRQKTTTGSKQKAHTAKHNFTDTSDESDGGLGAIEL